MNTNIEHPLFKASAAVGSFLAMDWLTQVGQVCAALTAIALFSELVWKKVIFPLITYFREENRK